MSTGCSSNCGLTSRSSGPPSSENGGIAFAAWTAHSLPEGLEPGLEATYVYDPPNFSWPAGAHIAIVEVDEQMGLPALERHQRLVGHLDARVLPGAAHPHRDRGACVQQGVRDQLRDAQLRTLAELGAPDVAGPTIGQACATGVRVLQSAAAEIRDGGATIQPSRQPVIA